MEFNKKNFNFGEIDYIKFFKGKGVFVDIDNLDFFVLNFNDDIMVFLLLICICEILLSEYLD